MAGTALTMCVFFWFFFFYCFQGKALQKNAQEGAAGNTGEVDKIKPIRLFIFLSHPTLHFYITELSKAVLTQTCYCLTSYGSRLQKGVFRSLKPSLETVALFC